MMKLVRVAWRAWCVCSIPVCVLIATVRIVRGPDEMTPPVETAQRQSPAIDPLTAIYSHPCIPSHISEEPFSRTMREARAKMPCDEFQRLCDIEKRRELDVISIEHRLDLPLEFRRNWIRDRTAFYGSKTSALLDKYGVNTGND